MTSTTAITLLTSIKDEQSYSIHLTRATRYSEGPGLRKQMGAPAQGPSSFHPTYSSLLVLKGSHTCGHPTYMYLQALSTPLASSGVVHHQKGRSREETCPELLELAILVSQ